MKRLLLISFILLSAFINAQGANKDSVFLSSISISSGDGVLSQGILFESSFHKGKDLISLYLGERDLGIAYLKNLWKEKLLAGPVLEYYLNLPTIGFQLIFSPLDNLTLFSWTGFSAGNPGEKLNLEKWRYLFYYQSLEYSYKNLSCNAIIMEHRGWQPIIYFKYTQPLLKNVNLFGSVGYNFFGEGRALLRLGITYKK